MKNILRELYSLDEVAGLFISNGELPGYEQIKAGVMPVDVPDIVSAFCKLRKEETLSGGAGSEIVVAYREAVLVFAHLKKNDWLHVVCRPGVNSDSILSRIRVAVNNLKASGKDEQAASKNKELPAGTETVLRELIKVVGPMGEILFRDAETKWKSGLASETALEDFIRYVNTEINDMLLSEQFESGIEQSLSDTLIQKT